MDKKPLEKLGDEVEAMIEGAENAVDNILHKKKKPFYKKGFFWLILAFVIVLILGFSIYSSTYLPIQNSMRLASQVQISFEKVQTYLLAADFNNAKREIENTQQLLEKLEADVNRLNTPLFIGYLRRQYEAVEAIVSATSEFNTGLYLLTDLAQEVLTNVETRDGNLIISPTQRQQILQKFSYQTPQLNQAKNSIELSLTELNEIQITKLNPQLTNYILTLKDKLSLLRNFLDKSVNLSQSLPSLLALNSTKTYLFLLQNYNELRPTGGFIGTLGILKIQNGNIISFETSNVYDYDKYAHDKLKVIPPTPISKYLQVNGWYMRDSNWSPDFPTAAKQIEWFYHQEAALSGGVNPNYSLDGIIAVTPKLVEEFLAIAGAVEAKSHVFNAQNFVDQLQYLVEVGYEDQGVAYWERKNIIGVLAQNILARTENLNVQGWIELVKSILNNLNSKHIIIYSHDLNVQETLLKQNWAGALSNTTNDYLMVVDANMAALKSNSCVDRSLTYQVIPQDDDLAAKVSIQYQNNCTFTWKSTRYRTYTRVYVPQGSELIKTYGAMEYDHSNSSGQTDVTIENGKTVFGAFISIEPGESGTLSFEYKLPDYITDKIYNPGYYNLTLQKQAGTLKEPIDIKLKLPEKITSANPGEPRTAWGDNKYDLTTNLEIDREIHIGF